MTENKYINLNNLNTPFCKTQIQDNIMFIFDNLGVKQQNIDYDSNSINSTLHNSANKSRIASLRSSENKENSQRLSNIKLKSPLNKYSMKPIKKYPIIKYENELFGLFNDDDIGFTHFWRSKLQINNNNEDDDYDTDDEQQNKVKVILRIKTNSFKKTLMDELKINNFSLSTNYSGHIKFSP